VYLRGKYYYHSILYMRTWNLAMLNNFPQATCSISCGAGILSPKCLTSKYSLVSQTGQMEQHRLLSHIVEVRSGVRSRFWLLNFYPTFTIWLCDFGEISLFFSFFLYDVEFITFSAHRILWGLRWVNCTWGMYNQGLTEHMLKKHSHCCCFWDSFQIMEPGREKLVLKRILEKFRATNF
jgi:hypothetical protein